MILAVFPATADCHALDDAARWTHVNIPAPGETGKWALAPDSDIRCLTMADDGTLYACTSGPTFTLYSSTDGGVSWSHVGNVQDEIIDIVISTYDGGTIYYATKSDVYRSTDGGVTFQPMTANLTAGSDNIEITSIDVTRLENNIIAVGTRDIDSNEFGEVYILDEANLYSGWTATDIGDYDVYAVAFSPSYTTDYQLIAVVTDEIDTFTANRRGSMTWNALEGMSRLVQYDTGTSVIVATPAAIAFPDNYDSSTGSLNNAYYVGIGTGTGEGDVYRIDSSYALYTVATDLNVGYTYGLDNLDISSLDAAGAFPDVSLAAGASGSSFVYYSDDGGTSWENSRKEPTGETITGLLLSPDFITTGLTYAASSGSNSALSVSRDGGNTWNQLSFIDDTIDAIIDMTPSLRYEDDTTLFMITFGSGHSLWHSRNGGQNWERVLVTRPADGDILSMVGLPPQYGDGCRTLFLAGESNGQPAVWKSTDDGQEYRRRQSHDPNTGAPVYIDAWTIIDENTLFVGGFDGTNGIVYKTINSGFFYSRATPAGSQPLCSLAVSPEYGQDGTILVGNTNGRVYWSNNDGISFQSLPPDDGPPPLTGSITVAFDPDFANNNTVYAASDTADGGIYRFVIGESTSWENIDSTLPSGAELSQVIASDNGVLYASNVKNNGGMERSLNPKDSAGASFETVTQGLDDGASLSGLRLTGNRVWSIDTVNNILLTYNDTLTTPIEPVSPENGAPGAGNLIENTVRNITLEWESVEGATSYEWRCDVDNDFSSIPEGFEATTQASSVRLPVLEPATTYYWQVRVNTPVTSPWSEKYTFTTTMAAETVSLELVNPSAGATGVPVKPVFQWTETDGATAYELLVSPNADFSSPVIVKEGDYALTSNAWRCDVRLDNDTTYYWKVRAVGVGTNSDWSAAGAFTTETLPEEEPVYTASEPEPAETPETANITPVINLGPQAIELPEVQLQPAAPPAWSPTTPAPYTEQSLFMQDWIIYLIGGLVITIMFALLIIFMMVLKMRRA